MRFAWQRPFSFDEPVDSLDFALLLESLVKNRVYFGAPCSSRSGTGVVLITSVRRFELGFLASMQHEELPFSAYLMSFITRANICARWDADSVPMAHNPARSLMR